MTDKNYTSDTGNERDIQEVRLRGRNGEYVGGSGEPTVDSTGLPLPADFYTVQRNFTRNTTGSIATEFRVTASGTYSQTYTRDSDDNITSISKWVKS